MASADFVADGRRRTGAGATGLLLAADVFLFDDGDAACWSFFAGVPRDEVFFTTASPPVFAFFATGAAFAAFGALAA